MLARVALVALFAFAACAGTAASSIQGDLPQPGAAPSPKRVSATEAKTAWVIRDLAAFSTVEAMRKYLEAGLERRDLLFVGFDEVSAAQCVERLISAVQDFRQRPDDRLVHENLTDSVDAYDAAMQEAAVRRSVGRGCCLPFMK